MKAEQSTTHRRATPVWVLLVAILLLALLLRLTGIWRTEPIDWHSDEYAIAQSVVVLANNGSIGLKPLYNWPSCSVIHPLGHALYALKGWFGPYSYDSILIIQRIISTIASTATVFIIFLVMKKLFSLRAALFAAMLVAVAMLPTEQGHYGTIISIVSLIIALVMLLSYNLFDVDRKNHSQLKAGRCCLLGLLCGWGIAARWDILLAAIPISAAFFLSFWSQRKTVGLSEFARINAKRVGIIIGITAVAFLAGIPDIQFAPDKVVAGFNYEMRHHQLGHYGGFTTEEGRWYRRIARTAVMLGTSGNIYTLIAGIAATIFCLLKPTRPRVLLLWTMYAWLAVVFRNFVATMHHHLIPFIVMLMIIAGALDAGTKNRIGWLRTTCWAIFVFLVIGGTLYTCITISPLWRPDSIFECAKWIKANISTDNGLIWAPICKPDMSLARIYPREPAPGKDLYIIAINSAMLRFKKHPPSRKIVPSEWFPAQPPTMETLMLYAEMNAGGGPNLTLVKRFWREPSFLGLDCRLFLQSPGQKRIMADRGVTLFRFNKPNQVGTTGNE
jgi:4-amino-4-deoxy-L-arabinose transferase-like glycosyltransferase